METTIILGLHWGYAGIMRNDVETTTMGYIGFRVQGKAHAVLNS